MAPTPLFQSFNERTENMEDYLERFDIFTEVQEIDETKKVRFFLSSLDASMYGKLKILATPNKPVDLTFNEISTLLLQFHNPKPLTCTERQRFRGRKQNVGESFNSFLTSLKEISRNCGFVGQARLEEELRDQIIAGIANENTQNYFLRTDNLSLKDVMDKALADEQASHGVNNLKNGSVQKINEVDRKKYYKGNKNFQRENNSFQSNKTSRPEQKCYRCGLKNHKANECKYKNTTCFKCNKVGHLKSQCRKKADTYVINQSNAEILSINARSPHTKILIPIKIDGKTIPMELDTGATYSLISQANFKKLKIPKKLEKTNVILRTYDNATVKLLGTVIVTAEYKGKVIQGKLYIVEGNLDTILGRDWIFKMNIELANVLKTGADVTQLINKYEDIFSDKAGCLANIEVNLKIKENMKPVFCKARSVPYALKEQIEKELERLEALNIIEKIPYAEWATPIVPIVKGNGKIRICGDYKVTLNKGLVPDEHPIPNIEDVLAKIATGSIFSKFDIREAYLHMTVSDESAKLLTINTHKGLYKVKRLMYGVTNAPAIWQRTIETLLSDIEGLQVFYDDIKISSPTEDIHYQRVNEFFKRCREFGIKLNREKCQIKEKNISYLGFTVNETGIWKTEEKIKTITNAKRPTSITQLKSFLGLVTYYGRFIPNLANKAFPLYELLKKNARFNWGHHQQTAFDEIKREISSDRSLAHYDPTKPLILATDASSYGIGAVLSHILPDGTERPIAFASRSLNTAERNYSQIDKEALSIYWGVKKYFNYVYGREFTLLTDHKPLVSILSAQSAAPGLTATRLLHYAIFLQGFTYTIKYRTTKNHANADFCSRFPIPERDENVDECTTFQLNQINTVLNAEIIAQQTKQDKVLNKMLKDIKDKDPNKLNINGEYTIEHGCLLRGRRVIIPKLLQAEILKELHVGHLGIVKMKGLARSYVYWKNIDRDIEDTCKSCYECGNIQNQMENIKPHPWEYPKGPWERIHVDYAGPMNGNYFLIIVDAYSKWPEVFHMKSTTTNATLEKLRECCARFGLPYTIVSDNGPQFTSTEFNSFTKENGIRHILTAPYHPASNGQAERYVQTVKNALKASVNSGLSITTQLSNFLLQYRRAPHSTTGTSPASSILKNEPRTRLDLVHRYTEETLPRTVVYQKDFQRNATVAFRVYNRPGQKWDYGVIKEKLGTVIFLIKCRGEIVKRHLNQIKNCSSELVNRNSASHTSKLPKENLLPTGFPREINVPKKDGFPVNPVELLEEIHQQQTRVTLSTIPSSATPEDSIREPLTIQSVVEPTPGPSQELQGRSMRIKKQPLRYSPYFSK